MALTIRPAERCRYDLVSLGEVMLRLDPGEGRIRAARSFQVWEGGGEYNVARGLRKAFGLRTAVVTALADNEIGRLIEELILAGGVDTSLVRWVPYDGIGRTVRNGLNFTERGFGVRGPLGVSDRGHSAASQLRPQDVDWDHLFGELGVRWLHTGGIFAALSESCAETAVLAATTAKKYGTVVSYDLNYRPSLWSEERATAVNRRIAEHVDVLFGNEGHFASVLGVPAPGFESAAEKVAAQYPGLRVIAGTVRTVHSASAHDWGGIAWSPETGVVGSRRYERTEILDRVGGGDAFAAGLAFGLLDGAPLPTALEYAVAHGALVMTTPGDTSMASRAEVLRLAAGGEVGIDR